MRKFYTTLAAAALVLSASAANLNLKADIANKLQSTENVVAKAEANGLRQTSKAVNIEVNSQIGNRGMVAVKADGEATIEGTWTFQLGDYYFQSSANSSIYVDFEATLDGNDVWFEDPTGYELPFVGIYDEAKSTIIFGREYLGQASGYYVYQQPFVYNYATNDLDDAELIATYSTVNGGLLTFEADHGISWIAYTDAAGRNQAGYFGIYDLERATKSSGEAAEIDEEQEGKWKAAGTVTFVDAWILPSYSMGGVQINPNEFAYDVELQQSVDNENLYRLWEPYKGNILSLQGLNQSKYHGQIQFDVTNPDYVVVVPCGLPSGFKNSNGEFYMSNELGWYMNYLGADAETIIALAGDDITPDTFVDGVVTINVPMFDFSAAYADGYNWNNNPYASIITFPKEEEPEPEPGEEGDITGTMTSQFDMNLGALEEPELEDPYTQAVTASYVDGKLTIYNFGNEEYYMDGLNPIVFNVDLTTGDATTDYETVSSEEDGEEYYYGNPVTKEPVVSGKIENVDGEDKCVLTIDWAAEMMYLDEEMMEMFGLEDPWYPINALANIVIELDFTISDLSGVQNIVAADNNAPVVYYNLQGIRVAEPANGIFIRVEGNKTSKVLVK